MHIDDIIWYSFDQKKRGKIAYDKSSFTASLCCLDGWMEWKNLAHFKSFSSFIFHIYFFAFSIFAANWLFIIWWMSSNDFTKKIRKNVVMQGKLSDAFKHFQIVDSLVIWFFMLSILIWMLIFCHPKSTLGGITSHRYRNSVEFSGSSGSTHLFYESQIFDLFQVELRLIFLEGTCP